MEGGIIDLKVPEGLELRIIINNDDNTEKHIITFFLQTPNYKIFTKKRGIKRMFSRALLERANLQSVVDEMYEDFKQVNSGIPT